MSYIMSYIMSCRICLISCLISYHISYHISYNISKFWNIRNMQPKVKRFRYEPHYRLTIRDQIIWAMKTKISIKSEQQKPSQLPMEFDCSPVGEVAPSSRQVRSAVVSSAPLSGLHTITIHCSGLKTVQLDFQPLLNKTQKPVPVLPADLFHTT